MSTARRPASCRWCWPVRTPTRRRVGDGVLGMADRLHVVFCQLPPDSVDPALGSRGANIATSSGPTATHVSLVARLLGNMGVAGATPLLDAFLRVLWSKTRVDSVGENGDFAAAGDADGVADAVAVFVERQGGHVHTRKDAER